MTPMRFTALAEAYGGEIGNWPAGTQDEARALLRLQPDLWSVLQEQRGLDAALAAWTVAEPGAALTGRIVAVVAAQQARARRWRAWLSGVGAATVLAGGVAAGVIVVMMASPAPEQGVSSLYQLTVLGAPLDINIQTTAIGPT